MQRTSFSALECPVARTLELVGEWWSILILRDAFHGICRFDQFQRSLGIAPNMLSRRLSTLVRGGLLEKRAYGEKPVRHEYLLTDRGRAFFPVLVTLMEFGSGQLSPEGRSVEIVDAATAAPVAPRLVDASTGRAIEFDAVALVPGPASSEAVRRRLAYADRKRRERLDANSA